MIWRQIDRPPTSGPTVLMTLAGGGNSYSPDGKLVIWTQHYVLEFNPVTLTEKVVGYDMGSGTVADGEPAVTEVMTCVNKDISPIGCKAFK